MRINSIELRNFRGIEKLSLKFPDTKTSVIVGINGAGKSSLLDCMAIMLSRLIGRIRASTETGRFFSEYDIRNGTAETRNSIEITLGSQILEWSVSKTGHGKKAQSITNLENLKQVVAQFLPKGGVEESTNIPLAVYYHVNRAVLDIPLRIRGRHEFNQLTAYDQALTGARNDFRLFFEWFRKREDIENEELRDLTTLGKQVLREPSAKYGADRQLRAVRTATEKLMPGFTNLRVCRYPTLKMTVEKAGAELVVNQLSNGEKCLLAMTGDLARRLAIANPSLNNPLDGQGVVLIDEVDLHLHPQWQRMIIPSLERTFPNCQFIVTTHSPLVLSYLKKEQVFLIEDFKLVEKTPHTYGRDIGSILFDVMAVLDRPDEIKNRLEQC
ncbi:MAG: AAA family ATPase, partial [Bacteroidales bacterium]|nr:AAA family ATPase [Bacteroidales bacterium]